MSVRIGVDIGGTFTDFSVLDERSGALKTLKVLSTPEKPGAEVLNGVTELGRRYAIKPSDITYFTHGTTVGVNTVIQRRGAPLALFVTQGFEDVLEVARLKMPDPYDLFSRRPPPLVPRERVYGIAERTLADGSVKAAVDAGSVRAAVSRARADGAETIVVALLHAYANPANEQRVGALIREAAPDMEVTLSSAVWPVIREYERTVTATVSGYVQKRVAHYLGSLQAALKSAGVPAEAMITKSNGGIMSAEVGKSQCINMLLSGTASGVIGASFIASQAGIQDVMSFDVGGTSADVAIIRDGRPEFGVGEIVGDFPIYIPTVSVSSIGAGGGSIASVDGFGVLKVGPESAGSTPGPACYGRGGTRACITDAYAVLGLLGDGELGYGAVRLDIAKARAAVGEIAEKLKLSVEAAAESIIRVSISGMFLEVSKLMSRAGVDPRTFTLLPFGGAGPMTACFLARDLGMRRVVVPPTPGVLSAFGGLIADVRNDFIRTTLADLDAAGLAAVARHAKDLETRAMVWVREEQRFKGDVRVLFSGDMRYRGQSYEIEVPLDASAIAAGDAKALSDAFHREHARVYEHADPRSPVQIVNLRAVVVGASPRPTFAKAEPKPHAAKPVAATKVWLDGKSSEAKVYARKDLAPGARLSGPAIVMQDDCTTCILNGFDGEVDAYSNLVLTAKG